MLRETNSNAKNVTNSAQFFKINSEKIRLVTKTMSIIRGIITVRHLKYLILSFGSLKRLNEIVFKNFQESLKVSNRCEFGQACFLQQ